MNRTLVGCCLLAAAALATPGAAWADDAAKAQAAPPVKQVCHYEKVVGSHMRTRVCMTPAQAKAAEEAAQQAMQKARDVGNLGNASGG